jgi:hypothetical protein
MTSGVNPSGHGQVRRNSIDRPPAAAAPKPDHVIIDILPPPISAPKDHRDLGNYAYSGGRFHPLDRTVNGTLVDGNRQITPGPHNDPARGAVPHYPQAARPDVVPPYPDPFTERMFEQIQILGTTIVKQPPIGNLPLAQPARHRPATVLECDMIRQFRASVSATHGKDMLQDPPMMEYGAIYDLHPNRPDRLEEKWFDQGEKDLVRIPSDISGRFFIHSHPPIPGYLSAVPSEPDALVSSFKALNFGARSYFMNGATGKVYEIEPAGAHPRYGISYVELRNPDWGA